MKTVKIPAGSLVVLSGLPGAGKSSLKASAQGFRDLDAAWLSMDDFRLRLLGSTARLDERGESFEMIPQSANHEVFEMLRLAVKARLAHGRTCILDGTWPTDEDRLIWFKLAQEYGAPFKVLILDTGLEECLKSDATRRHRVGSSVIEALSQRFQRHSRFDYELINRGDCIEQELPFLQGEAWDVVTDIHGMYDEFLSLLKLAGWQIPASRLSHPAGRKLLVLGDMVDRGPRSLEVLRLLRQACLDGVAVCLLGNHDKKLLRFYDAYQEHSLKKWTSWSNAETGMQLIAAEDARELAEFLRGLPHYRLVQTSEGYRLAFAHADLHHFDAELTSKNDCLYGQAGVHTGVDSDALYEAHYQAGLNKWVLIRGHIPTTSKQEHVFSLERQAFQNGELVMMRLDAVLAALREGKDYQTAYRSGLMTVQCRYDFKKVSQKWALAKGLDYLVEKKLATSQSDSSGTLKVYKYSKRTFWDNAWDQSPWLAKARGIVVDVGGRIVSHPFDKLFNYGENGTALNLPDELPIVAVDKLNGFLGICSAHPFKRGELLVHTQGSFEGEFVDYFKTYLMQPRTRGLIGRFLSRHDVTLMFEVLHPNDPHIIAYPQEMMGIHLLGIRGKALSDLPWTEEGVDAAAREMELRRPSWSRTTLGKLKSRLREGFIEGYVVRKDTNEQRHLFKWKTPYYLTTKFLGRLSSSKINHMFGNPNSFKQTLDEEFYQLVDLITTRFDKRALLEMSHNERILIVRNLLQDLLGINSPAD